jgi:CubicO group peptidase (beta-lactamase class C family)
MQLPLILVIASLLLTSCGGGGNSSNDLAQPDPVQDDPVQDDIVDNSIWEEASPESVGMNSTLLSEAFDTAFADGTYTQAAVVIKDNKLVFERYRGIATSEESTLINESSFDPEGPSAQTRFGNRDKDSLVTSWSTAKSFASVLIGIAIGQDFIESLDQSASEFIDEWADDDRAQITLRNLLDMRSGLEMICLNQGETTLAACTDGLDDSDIMYFDDQLDACIKRTLSGDGIGESGVWSYSNCDSMLLGEILYQATGQDLETYADINLFSKIGMDAEWWQDNDPTGQVDGNYLSFCCIDATIRDFAKFGQLLLNNGVWDGEQVVPASYVESIKNVAVDALNTDTFGGTRSYGLQFWTVPPVQQDDGNTYPPANSIITTAGFDGQYVMVDFANNLLVLRNSIYEPAFYGTEERKWKLLNTLDGSDFTATLPAYMGINTASTFNNSKFLYQVTQAINSD